MAIDIDVAVVGAGPAGLGAAFAALAAGRDVAVLEAEPEAGGNLRAVERDGYRFALGPQALPRSAASAWWLARRAGVTDRIVAPASRAERFVFRGGRLHALPTNPMALLATRLMSVRGRLRLLAEPWQPAPAAARIEGESVRAFFTRRMGGEATDALVAPFVTGIHAGDPDALEAASAFPSAVGWERSSGSLARGALADWRRGARRDEDAPRASLWSFRGGLGILARACASVLETRLRVSSRVEAVVRDGSRWRLETSTGALRCRHVVLAVPPAAASRLLARPCPAAASLAASVPAVPVAVVHLGGPLSAGERAPSGFGALVARGEGASALGIVFTSSLLPDAAPAGAWLQATYLGGALDAGVLDRSDDELVATAAADTRRVLGFDPARGVALVLRHAGAIPQLVRGHRARMDALRRELGRLQGLAVAGNWLDGVGVDAAIASGMRALTGMQEAAAA